MLAKLKQQDLSNGEEKKPGLSTTASVLTERGQ